MAAKPRKIKTVRELRKYLMLTQVEFAEKLKVRQPLVSMWENGGHVPSLDSYHKMAKMAKAKGIVLELE